MFWVMQWHEHRDCAHPQMETKLAKRIKGEVPLPFPDAFMGMDVVHGEDKQ